jgi:CheY-like chemotaxis protein
VTSAKTNTEDTGGGVSRSLTVLLADADPAARHVLRRVLLREFKSIVVEADNGIQVLEELDTQDVDALILDLKIPGLGGIDVLRDIRQSKRHRHLPVVIVTERKDEATIRDAVELGVSDYVLKDQHQAVIVERMRRVFSSERQITSHAHSGRRTMMQAPSAFTVLVVDEDHDFRHFCTDVFRSKYEVVTIASAAQAMAMSLTQPPNAILIGSATGTMGQEAFARRIRQLDTMSETRLVAVVTKNRLEEARATGLYDCVAVRSFVPETFLLQFEQTLRPPGVLAKVTVAMPGFRSQAISAVEQVFGMMLGTEVNILENPPAVPKTGLSVQVPVTLAEQNADILVGASISEKTGLELAARMLQSPLEELPGDAAQSALAEILNMVGGRVQHGLTANGLRAQIGLPVTGAPNDPTGDTVKMGFGFDSMNGEPQEFTLCISERESVVRLDAAPAA